MFVWGGHSCTAIADITRESQSHRVNRINDGHGFGRAFFVVILRPALSGLRDPTTVYTECAAHGRKAHNGAKVSALRSS